MNTLRNYRTELWLTFSQRDEPFKKGPYHEKTWLAIIAFLRRRGFKISKHPLYQSNWKCLSKDHKIGYKNDVVSLLETTPTSIKVIFQNVRNLWESKQSAWTNPSDNRYQKLSYIENIRVNLELQKLTAFCLKFDACFVPEDSTLSPEEYIINRLKSNRHIHGVVAKLEDIKEHIKSDSYDYKHNSNDGNGKKIICGDRKYFYDYQTRRLSTGIVWHNINNMWWVIINDTLKNLASFELFDYDSSLPRRKSLTIREADSLIKRFCKNNEFLKAHYINSRSPKAA